MRPQPNAEGAFRRGPGLNLTSGQYTAPVAGFYALAATLHVGEARGWGGAWGGRPAALGSCRPVTAPVPPPQRWRSRRDGRRRAPGTACACSSASSPGASTTREWARAGRAARAPASSLGASPGHRQAFLPPRRALPEPRPGTWGPGPPQPPLCPPPTGD